MIDPKKVDMNQLPKKFCDGAIGNFGKEYFAIAFTAGNNLDSFAMTPKNMKSISTWMNKQVEKYENQFGVIDMSPSPVQSPIQMADLQNGEEGK
jgi:hypothetical protein